MLLMRNRVITVNDKMQQGYCYILTEPSGRNFDPDFEPDLTPHEMLCLGVFGGKYMTDSVDEFPSSWFVGAKLSPQGRDDRLNYFGVHASQSLSVWHRKGWIHPDDPRGWFQWYCRYYFGRRMPDEDRRQIGRWRAMSRHVRQRTRCAFLAPEQLCPSTPRDDQPHRTERFCVGDSSARGCNLDGDRTPK